MKVLPSNEKERKSQKSEESEEIKGKTRKHKWFYTFSSDSIQLFC
jgi:hypothetical protein